MPFQPDKPYNDLPLLPPLTDLQTPEILRAVTAASRPLERLNTQLRHLPNPTLLLNNLVLLEAQDSSRIENIVTTQDQLFRGDVLPESVLDEATKEVRRYRQALWEGVQALEQQPITTNLLVRVMQRVKDITAGVRQTPGTVLKNQHGASPPSKMKPHF